MKRIIVSIILSLVMTFAMIPTTVFGADKISFQDVSSNAFYYDAVMWAVTHHPVITNGTDPTHFSPEATCTRGQVVTFLWRAAGEPKPTSEENPFTDVKSGAYYYDAVLWAVENNITTGTNANTFGPDNGCTRGQVVTFLYRTAEEPSVKNVSHPFNDVSDKGYYYNAVLWAVVNEVTAGTSATTFSPDNTCTRGQIVTFLYRARDFLTGIDFSDEEIEQEIETVTDLNQSLSDIESEYTITDNAQETADQAEAIIQEMLDYCNEQKEAGEIVNYEQDGSLIIIQLEIGKFIYEFQPIPDLQGSSSNMDINDVVNERAELTPEISKKAALMDDSAGLSRIATVEPFKNEFNVNIYDHAAQAIEDANLGFDFALNADSEEVTVDLVRNLEGYKVIIWNGHGSFAKKDEIHSVLGLGELCSKEKNKEYKDYLTSSQLVYFGGGEKDYGKAHYAVTTKFFDECFDSGSFKDSLVFLGTCCSAQDPYLEQTLINKGAEAVFGYSDPVNPRYNQEMCQTIFEELLKKDADGNTRTAALALSNAKKLNGQKDPYWTNEQEAILDIISLGILGFDQHAELLLKEKDSSSYRLSDYGGKGVLDHKVFNGHRYQAIKKKTNWVNAQKLCEANGGHLVTITSAEENEVCKSLCEWANVSGMLIGLSDAAVEGSMSWVTGESLTYSNFSSGEPNNQGNEDYVLIRKNGTWNDGHLDRENWCYICEWETEKGSWTIDQL